MKTKITRRALFTSVMALVVCVTMLMGTTFAWFTDTATVSVNTIQSGTLDIDLVDGNGDSIVGNPLEFVKAEGHENEEILWEPGCTYNLPAVYVENNGNLAVKYKVVISGINGADKLNEVIDWTIEYADNDTDGGLITGTDEYFLLPGKTSGAITVSGHMQETAGNEYQTLTIDGAAITVYATQYSYEYDSYGNTYDENADGTPDLPQYSNVNSTAELNEAMKNAEANDVIVLNSGTYELTENLASNGTFEVKEGASVVLELNGQSINTNASVNSDEEKINQPTILNNGDLTIVGGTIENKNATAGNTNVAAVENASGTLTLKDCVLTNESPTSGGAYAVSVKGGTVILENCTVDGNRGAISVTGGSLTMIGGSATANIYYPVYLSGEATAEFNGVTFTKLNNRRGQALIYNALTTGTATFTDCTFVSSISGETKLEINNTLTRLTFTDCTYNNVTAPN